MDETVKGLIADLGRTYAPDDPVRSRDLNRWQADLARLSWALQKMGVDLHYPHTATSDNKFQAAASADKVALDPGTRFILAGVPFDTADLDPADLEFSIPDDSTRFLRVEPASDCGAAVLDDPADPNNKNWIVTRDLKLSFSLVSGTEEDAEGTGGGPSSPESMRILKAVKGAAGTSPAITLYENKGHGHISASLDSANLRGGVKVFDSSGTFEPGVDGVPDWVRWVWVELVGGGGGGGYLQASGFNGHSGAGAGGAFAGGWAYVEPGTPKTVTVGLGGLAGPDGTTDGDPGGTSSFGVDVSAPGGEGGESINSAYGSEVDSLGGSKAACVGEVAEDGGPGCHSGGSYTAWPMGGTSRFGHPAHEIHSDGSSSNGAVGPGVGGRGGKGSNGASVAGEDGNDGEVRVFWFGPIITV